MVKVFKLLLLLSFVFAVGCEKKQGSFHDLKNQSTPQECLGKLYDATRNEDFDSFCDCFTETDINELKKSFYAATESVKLQNMIENIYSTNSWTEVRNITIVKDFQTIFVTQPYSREAFLATIEVKENKASFYCPPNQYSKCSLTKKGNNWYYNQKMVPVEIFCGSGLGKIYKQTTSILINSSDNLSLKECMVLTNIIYYKSKGGYKEFREALLELHPVEMIEKLEALCD